MTQLRNSSATPTSDSTPADELNVSSEVSLTRLFGTNEQFELRGMSFFVVPEEAWNETSPATAQRELKLRAVGKLQIQGRTHVILCAHARAADAGEVRGLAHMLTQRELQIATMVADGWANKAIARRLSISEYTVREHVRRMFHKANVSKRAALAALVSRLDVER